MFFWFFLHHVVKQICSKSLQEHACLHLQGEGHLTKLTKFSNLENDGRTNLYNVFGQHHPIMLINH